LFLVFAVTEINLFVLILLILVIFALFAVRLAFIKQNCSIFVLHNKDTELVPSIVCSVLKWVSPGLENWSKKPTVSCGIWQSFPWKTVGPTHQGWNARHIWSWKPNNSGYRLKFSIFLTRSSVRSLKDSILCGYI